MSNKINPYDLPNKAVHVVLQNIEWEFRGHPAQLSLPLQPSLLCARGVILAPRAAWRFYHILSVVSTDFLTGAE